MKRTELVDKLKKVAPALSKNPIVPILCNFWFTGEQLLAYNDQIALAVPMRTDFKGAVSDKLLHLLEASHFEDLELAVEDNVLMVKRTNGRAAIKLTLTAPDFLFTMPRPGRGITGVSSLVRAIDHCLLSVGTDTSKSEYLGVTVVPEDDRFGLYSTDGNTISRARIKSNGNELPRVILPGEFCRQLVSLFDSGDDESRQCSFEIAQRDQEQYGLFTTDGIILYGRVIATNSPLNFSAILANLIPSRAADLVAIPEQFSGAVERACIICDKDRGHVTIKIADGKMRLRSQSEGEADVEDVLPISRNHPSVSIKVEPRLLKRGGSFESMLIRESCVIMSRGSRLYLIACHS
jgi:DNA polymerase III sliding clamp (beta) subunit (PCNA family)